MILMIVAVFAAAATLCVCVPHHPIHMIPFFPNAFPRTPSSSLSSTGPDDDGAKVEERGGEGLVPAVVSANGWAERDATANGY